MTGRLCGQIDRTFLIPPPPSSIAVHAPSSVHTYDHKAKHCQAPCNGENILP